MHILTQTSAKGNTQTVTAITLMSASEVFNAPNNQIQARPIREGPAT
jgi:hypothetical protein